MTLPVQLQLDPVCLGIPDDPDDNSVRRVLDFMQQASNDETRLRWLDSPFYSDTYTMGSTSTATIDLTYVFCSS